MVRTNSSCQSQICSLTFVIAYPFNIAKDRTIDYSEHGKYEFGNFNVLFFKSKYQVKKLMNFVEDTPKKQGWNILTCL